MRYKVWYKFLLDKFVDLRGVSNYQIQEPILSLEGKLMRTFCMYTSIRVHNCLLTFMLKHL